MKLSSSFRVLPFSVEMSPVCLKYIYYVLRALTLGRYLQRLLPDSIAGFWLGLMHFPEALYHQRSRCREVFLRGTFCFFPLLAGNRFLYVMNRYSKYVV